MSRLKNLSFWDEYIEDMRVTFKTMQEEFIDAAALARDVTAHANRLEDLFMNARFQALILKRTD